jgi:L-lysine cyclodeaminase
MKPSVHVNAVGSDLPGKTELPLALLQRSLVCPDLRVQAVVEGECQQLVDAEIGPELHEVVQQPERFADWRSRSTVFDSTGFALEDQVVTELLLGHAQRLGIGTRLSLEMLSGDALDPYSAVWPLPGRQAHAQRPARPARAR